MRRSIYSVLVLGFALVLVPGVYAQTKKDTKSGLDRIEGRTRLGRPRYDDSWNGLLVVRNFLVRRLLKTLASGIRGACGRA